MINYIIKINLTMHIQANSDFSSVPASKGGEESEVAGFITKTFQILGVEQYQKIIYWAPNGLEFIIKDIVKFEQIVLPRYFRHNKMNSFVRQLNMYGFHKIKHNSFKSTFKHQFFQKDKEQLLPLIRRKPKLNEKDNDENVEEEVKPVQVKPQKIVPVLIKQQEHPTMSSDKWANMTQQFLVTTKMINLSLVKVSCSELSEINNFFAQEEQDCVSIEDELEQDQKQTINFQIFQNPTCFFASGFNL